MGHAADPTLNAGPNHPEISAMAAAEEVPESVKESAHAIQLIGHSDPPISIASECRDVPPHYTVGDRYLDPVSRSYLPQFGDVSCKGVGGSALPGSIRVLGIA